MFQALNFHQALALRLPAPLAALRAPTSAVPARSHAGRWVQAERRSERTQVTIWSLSLQAPPICQAPTLLLGPLLVSSHPPPSSSPQLYLLHFLSSSSAKHPPFCPLCPKALLLLLLFQLTFSCPRSLFSQSCSSFSHPRKVPLRDKPALSHMWSGPATAAPSILLLLTGLFH